MLCQLVLLVLFSSLQPGRLQEEGCDNCSLFQNINNNIVNLNSLIRSYIRRSEQFRAHMEDSMSSFREDMSSLNGSMNNLSTCLQQHKQQTAAELAQIQTSLTTTQFSLATHTQQVNSTLNTLTTSLFQLKQQTMSSLETTNSKLEATTAQLSADHQQIQTSISDVECVDLQSNLTHQLETIQGFVEHLPGHMCGGTGGWKRVVYLDMTNPSTICPSGWNMTGYSKRTCGRTRNVGLTCDSVIFPFRGAEYSRVCGRIKAYQWGATDAFYSYNQRSKTTINSAYIAGVGVSHGSPRQHIWTFVAGAGEGSPGAHYVCPCDADHTIHTPPFVGNDYFCESGVNEPWDYPRHVAFHSNDTLWDGENCLPSSRCCSLNNPPYFVKQLPTPTTDDIEARICVSYPTSDNVAVELVEFYVQ